ncbi:unnamed protein product, partial [Mesorhabditis belari]|uniref:Mitochondrial fission process protein 1 n=1 Tax=Mesorhabditis belari TaxID=2138241 RepID=A0AAF3EYH5_9BILA
MSDSPTNENSFDKQQRELQQIDLYRDTPIRYLGYANEIGEAFRSMLPIIAVKATYVIALGYATADALDKSRKEHKKTWPTVEERRKQVGIAAADTFLWQALASVAIPGFTINRVCYFTGELLKRSTRLPVSIQKWTTTFIGLGVIPFIVHPIDSAVEIGMDKTVRQFYKPTTHL